MLSAVAIIALIVVIRVTARSGQGGVRGLMAAPSSYRFDRELAAMLGRAGAEFMADR